MPPYSLIWLRGLDCDGCTITALGDSFGGGIDRWLHTAEAGLPPLQLVHPALALEAGEAFIERLRACARGEAGPYAVLSETALPSEPGNGGWFAGLGEEAGQPVGLGTWLTRLSPAADFVMAIGDCAVWGGPHAIGMNPTGSVGVTRHLGPQYRSRLGLPVVNLPGCAVPSLVAILIDFVRWAVGSGPQPALDDHRRPIALYGGDWKGALALWQS